MSYWHRRTEEIMWELEQNHGQQEAFRDFLDGREYIEAVRTGHIQENDIILLLSFEGAQLYTHKASDCWIVIWIIFDHAPDTRYKKAQVLIAAIIPGPHKPKNMDSVLFPSHYHLAALQREGLPIRDAWRNQLFIMKPFLALQLWHISMDWLVTMENPDVVCTALSQAGINQVDLTITLLS
jgi:hypothetical protein